MASGQMWNELDHGLGDAGQTLAEAQFISADVCDQLEVISGSIDTPRDNDLFIIEIADPANFSATSVCENCELDTQIALLHLDGKPILFNDDEALGKKGSTLPLPSRGNVQPAGRYLLWISVFGNYPTDSDGRVLFGYTAPPGLTKVWSRQRGVGTLSGYLHTSDAREQGSYTVSLTGSRCAQQLDQPIKLDIQEDEGIQYLSWISDGIERSEIQVRSHAAQRYKTVGTWSAGDTPSRRQTYRLPPLEEGEYQVRLAFLINGATRYSSTVSVSVETPATHSMSAVYPNPFNPEATFELTVSVRQRVSVELYNLVGQHVATVTDRIFEPGSPTRVLIDGRTLAAGAYMLSVTGETFAESRVISMVR